MRLFRTISLFLKVTKAMNTLIPGSRMRLLRWMIVRLPLIFAVLRRLKKISAFGKWAAAAGALIAAWLGIRHFRKHQ